MKTYHTNKNWFVFTVKYTGAIVLLLGVFWSYGNFLYDKIISNNSNICISNNKNRISKLMKSISDQNSTSFFSLYADTKKSEESSINIEICRFVVRNNFVIVRKVNDKCFYEVKNIQTGQETTIEINCEGVCFEQ